MSELSKSFTPDLFEAYYLVDEDQNGLRLDQFCAVYLPSFSREQIKKKIKSGEVQIIGRPYPHKASVKVYHREKVKMFTPRGTLEDEYWMGKKLELELDPKVIYEDSDLIVISKPPYMTTHPTGKHLFNCATVYFEHRDNKTIHSIHRLDRETSGIQLLGKNPKSAEKFTSYFEKDLVKKVYFFIAHNNCKKDLPFIANERLGSEDNFIPRLFVHCYPFDSSKGKHAQTEFHTLFTNKNYILGLAFPQTGRQHQIRSHAAFHGLPLLGDKLYNGDPTVFMRFKDEIATDKDHETMQISRHALHALAIKINNQDDLYFKAPISFDLQSWLKMNFSELKMEDIYGRIDQLLQNKFKIKDS